MNTDHHALKLLQRYIHIHTDISTVHIVVSYCPVLREVGAAQEVGVSVPVQREAAHVHQLWRGQRSLKPA